MKSIIQQLTVNLQNQISILKNTKIQFSSYFNYLKRNILKLLKI